MPRLIELEHQSLQAIGRLAKREPVESEVIRGGPCDLPMMRRWHSLGESEEKMRRAV